LAFVFAFSLEEVMPVYELVSLIPNVQAKVSPKALYGGCVFQVTIPSGGGREQAIAALKIFTQPIQPNTVQELEIAVNTCAKGLHFAMTATPKWLEGFELPNSDTFDEALRSIITTKGIETCFPAFGESKLDLFEPVVVSRLGQLGVYVHKLQVAPTKCCLA
jgi:hypothetical protein